MNHLKITTGELAKICGVSQGTVDRALNNRTDINAATKQKILRAAKEYGYRQLVDGHDGIIGLVGIIVFDLNNEYFSKLITEVEYVLQGLGYGAVVMMTHYDRQNEIECIRNMYNMGVCGIIMCSVNSGEEFRNYLKLFNIPIVTVGNNIVVTPFVGVDDFTSMRDMTLSVMAEGYDDIVYFSPALNYSDAYAQRTRYEGFLHAASGKKYCTVTDIRDIKEKYPENTAVICSTDYYAFKVYFKTACTKVTGFDNLDAIEKYGWKIDSVGYSITQIAINAVDTALGIKEGSTLIDHVIVKHGR